MAVMAGNSGETCFSKYGSVSIKAKYCHEMVRALSARSINTHPVHARASNYVCVPDRLWMNLYSVCVIRTKTRSI